ncbi:MAG TPA: hypothetical protein VIL42_03905 [Sphingomicrobium sp.]|jgi:hypothetical protein
MIGFDRNWLVLSAVAASVVLAPMRCGAEVPQQPSGGSQAATLRSFGAAGDARTDDTRALVDAFAKGAGRCIDGEGRHYRVRGTVRIGGDLCLRNATIVQSLAPIDTRPFITRGCAPTLDAAAVRDCGDAAIPLAAAKRLNDNLSVRTLFVRPDRAGTRVKVTLDHVTVDRGRFPEAGSRTDAAGIWIESAREVVLSNVEVTGAGKGFGLLVLDSGNVTADNLHIHDLVWAPYKGDRPLVQAQVAQLGWNSVSIREFRIAGQDRVAASKFYAVRVQEQVSCASFASVRRLRIRNLQIARCLARFDTGDLPWQADGLNISRGSQQVEVTGGKIDSTWEAVDVVANGGGVDGLTITDLTTSNAFAFGLKLGYRLRGATLTNVRVSNSGMGGIVLYGPVSGVRVSGAQVSGVGRVGLPGGGILRPWPAGNRAGIRIDDPTRGEAAGAPRDIVVDATVASSHPGEYDFGFLNSAPGSTVRLQRLRATGFARREVEDRRQ